MILYHKWDVKNGFAYLPQLFSLISDGLGGVNSNIDNRDEKFVSKLTLEFSCSVEGLDEELMRQLRYEKSSGKMIYRDKDGGM